MSSPVLRQTHRKRALKKRVQEDHPIWAIVLVILGILLFRPFWGGQAQFYKETEFPYNTNTDNFSVDKAFEMLREGNATPAMASSNVSTLQYVVQVTNFILGFYFVLAVGIIIYHGILVMVARDNEERRKTAFKVIVNIAIATAVVLFSYVIVRFVVEFFQNPGTVLQ